MKKLLLLGSAVPTKLGMLAAQHAHTSDQTFTTSCGMAGNEMTPGALSSEVACRALKHSGHVCHQALSRHACHTAHRRVAYPDRARVGAGESHTFYTSTDPSHDRT